MYEQLWRDNGRRQATVVPTELPRTCGSLELRRPFALAARRAAPGATSVTQPPPPDVR